jgi:tetratricopeptide (TPR) repeat protein
LKAPAFSLPDAAGKQETLASVRGKFALLVFWSASAPSSIDQMRLLSRHASRLPVLAINIDDATNLPKAKSLASQQTFPFPVLFASDEVAGVYNIIYRYMFDRRRDLGAPTSFLLDPDGMIVKIYQGTADPQTLLGDVATAPKTAAERIHKALPFSGLRYQSSFQRNDFTYGVALFQHGYLDQAAESFQQVIAQKPDDAEAYYNLGTLNLRRHELEQARQALEQSLKLRPNYPEAWNNLGMIAAQQGQGDDAVKNFQQALLLRPDYATALLNLGNLYRRERSYDQADELLEKALAIQPNDPEVNYSLGMLYAQKGQMDQAAKYLQRAIDLRPGYPEALNNLGVLLIHQQDYANAQKQFETCIRLVPNFDQSYLNLARLYALQHQNEEARKVIEQLLQLQPRNANALQALEMLR